MSDPRTKGEALLDIRYCARLHFLHCRLYRRIRSALAITSLAAGASAFAVALNWMPGLVGLMGMLVAACSIIDVQCNFAERAVRHTQQRTLLLELIARSDGMGLADLDAEWARIKARFDDEIESLRAVAMNDNLCTHGFESEMRPETRLQRLMRAVA